MFEKPFFDRKGLQVTSCSSAINKLAAIYVCTSSLNLFSTLYCNVIKVILVLCECVEVCSVKDSVLSMIIKHWELFPKHVSDVGPWPVALQKWNTRKQGVSRKSFVRASTRGWWLAICLCWPHHDCVTATIRCRPKWAEVPSHHALLWAELVMSGCWHSRRHIAFQFCHQRINGVEWDALGMRYYAVNRII